MTNSTNNTPSNPIHTTRQYDTGWQPIDADQKARFEAYDRALIVREVKARQRAK